MSSYGQAARNQTRPNGNNVMNQNGSQAQYQLPTVPIAHPGFDPSQQQMRGFPPQSPMMSLPAQTVITFNSYGGQAAFYPPTDQNYLQQMPPMHPQQNMNYQQSYGQQYYMPQMQMGMQQAPMTQNRMPPSLVPPPSLPPKEEPPQAPRAKKILQFMDPTTQKPIELNDMITKDNTPAAPPAEQTAIASEFKKQFANQMRDAVKAKIDEKPAENTATEKDGLSQSAQNAKPKTSISSTSAEAAPLAQVDDVNKNIAQTEKRDGSASKEQDRQDHVPQISITTLDKENAVEKVAEAMVAPPSTLEDSEGVPAPVGTTMTSSVLVDNIEEEEENDAEKSEEDRAAEEAERNLLREAELIAQMKTLEDQQKEDLERNVYSREFLSSICTIEKVLKWTSCPLTEDELKSLGIDKSSAPARDTNKGTRETFKTKWMNPNPSRSYVGGRGSMDSSMRIPRGQNPRKPQVGRPSIERQIERAAPLRKAENAWKPDKKVEGVADEIVNKRQVLKNVRALMNKVTPTTQKELTQELLAFEVSSDPEVLKDVIEIIFDKAVEEPKFCPLYAEMCKAQVDLELQRSHGGNQSFFRNAILTRAQQTFTISKAEDDARIARVQAIDAENDEQKKAELTLALQEYDSKIRRRRFGNITFIGQLFSQQLLSYTVVSWCIMTLLRESTGAGDTFLPEIEEAIDCSVRLLESIGPKMESEAKRQEKFLQEQQQQGKSQGKGQPKQPPQRPAQQVISFDQFMTYMEDIKKKASPRIRFMILNLQELRSSKWQKRKTVEQGPKKLDDLHQEIKQEQIQNQVARERYERDQMRGTTTGGHRSDPRKAPIVGRNSLNSKGTSNDRRKAAANTASMSGAGAPPPQKKSLSQLNQMNPGLGRSSWGPKGASGGHPDNERKLSNAQAKGSREASEQRTSSADDEKARALESVRVFAQGDGDKAQQQSVTETPPLGSTSRDGSISPNPIRSNSQVSLDSQNDEPVDLTEDEKKAARSIHGRIEEVANGALQIDSCPEEFLYTAKTCNISIRAFFKAFAVTVLREMKQNLKLSGHILAVFLQSDELKKQMKDSSEAARGFADFCNYVIAFEEYEECPKIWERLAEVIINAVQCDLADFTGKRPQLEDFAQTFIEASKDPRKNRTFELLVVALRRMAEINKGLDEQQHESMTAMAYDEIKFIKQLSDDQSTKLREALKDQNIGGLGNLYALLSGTS